MNQKIPIIIIHPDRIITYYDNTEHYIRSSNDNTFSFEHLNNEAPENFVKSSRKANGIMSKQAIKKMKYAIDYLLLLSSGTNYTNRLTGRKLKNKFAFITLTLPSTQEHEDNEIKRKCLDPFIAEIKKYYKVKNYVWRAEKQKNGNIHFHIIIDKYIPHVELRNRWNRIINKLGYVNRYRAKMKEFYKNGFKVREDLKKFWSIKKQKEAYRRNQVTDYWSPNSTDIHSIRKIINIKSYLVKYLGKNEIENGNLSETEIEKLRVKGRIWGASRSLENVKGCRVALDGKLEKELINVLNTINHFSINDIYFAIDFLDIFEAFRHGANYLFSLFSEYILKEFNFNLQANITLAPAL